MQTKSFCEDLTEGKFSFPVIHAVHARPDDTRLLNILRQRTEDVDIKRHAVQWMIQLGSIKYTREVLKRLHTELLSDIVSFGGHQRLTTLLAMLDSQLDSDDTELISTPTDSKHPNRIDKDNDIDKHLSLPRNSSNNAVNGVKFADHL